ncbi:hypothetical protein VTJ49DRAFT_4953 [Mycothermus thermophilus]|uniref:Uncharacterized protein n=1 Tax=Humicola insolens TaxID=85995 RepID=A0ABR3VQI9_HUMIN
MVAPGIDGLDTPRTNVGDATFLSRRPDFDISQELSFHSPSKDTNLLQQLRNGGRPNLKTPRGSRAPFNDRRNLPAGLGGPEFTPLLKSATRNSARRYGAGKENGRDTPGFLAKIDESMTPMPAGETSMYGASRNTSSFLDNTPLPEVDSSSAASTPLVMKRRGKGPLDDGNQLSLREQENLIDKIEKENFGLKLKIHFLEDALLKAGPGFSEAALKENTELKVDKVTMQRELQRYKKHLTSAEKDLEGYRQQILELQEKTKRRHAEENQQSEIERLRQELQDKDAEIDDLRRELESQETDRDKIEKLQDEIGDLEADLRRKDDLITQHEDEIEELKERIEEAEDQLEDAKHRATELEEKAQDSDRLQEAKETIENLEANVRRFEQQIEDMKEKLQDAISQKDRAEADLEELQEEMANKSVVTKGLSRQVEEKVARLQSEVDKARQECAALEEEREAQQKEIDSMRTKLKEAREERDSAERLRLSLESKLDGEQGSWRREMEDLRRQLKEARQERDSAEHIRMTLESKLEQAQADLNMRTDEKALLQTRHDALTNESISLQREVSNLKKMVAELEESLEEERQHALDIERDIRDQFRDEIDSLKDEISNLQAECREKDNLYDNDSEKWEAERHNLEAERDRAEERAAGLQRTIDKLRDTEGALSSKESKLQEALDSEKARHDKEEEILRSQVDRLQRDLSSRQAMLEDLRNELSAVKDDLRQSQLECDAQRERVEALEDEVEILQATIDEESEKARSELDRAHKECDQLKQQVASLKTAAETARASPNPRQESARLRSQLAEATEKVNKLTEERRALQDRSSKLDAELRSVRASLEETKAERNELEAEIARLSEQGEDTFKLDQERVDLRVAKTKLEAELRRLKEENKALVDRRREVEESLEREIEKAAAEEDHLNDEIRELQAKLRQSSDNQESAALRRTIRELERRIEDYETKLAAAQFPQGEGNSELSLLHRELSAARKKELDHLQHDADQKETIKSLKRQIADLERKAHEAAVSRFASSPSSSPGSAQKAEISELRHQLSTANQSLHDLKKSLREAERKASASARELQKRLEEFDDEKLVLEQALEDAQVAAEESAASHEEALKKYKQKLDKYKRERDELAAALRNQQNHSITSSVASDMSVEERRDLQKMLRESQTTADRLDKELREHREALEELLDVETSLRKKLERARSERAAYRSSAEKLQKDLKKLKQERDRAVAEAKAAAEQEAQALVRVGKGGRDGVDTDAIIRAAEAAEKRHEKEIRGMVMQLEWLKACWDREAKLRSDAAYAKRWLMMQVEVRDACNKADLAIINRIRAQLKPSLARSGFPSSSRDHYPIIPTLPAAKHSHQQQLKQPAPKQPQQQPPPRTKTPRQRWRLALIAVKGIVRMQIGARDWARADKIRRRLAEQAPPATWESDGDRASEAPIQRKRKRPPKPRPRARRKKQESRTTLKWAKRTLKSFARKWPASTRYIVMFYRREDREVSDTEGIREGLEQLSRSEPKTKRYEHGFWKDIRLMAEAPSTLRALRFLSPEGKTAPSTLRVLLGLAELDFLLDKDGEPPLFWVGAMFGNDEWRRDTIQADTRDLHVIPATKKDARDLVDAMRILFAEEERVNRILWNPESDNEPSDDTESEEDGSQDELDLEGSEGKSSGEGLALQSTGLEGARMKQQHEAENNRYEALREQVDEILTMMRRRDAGRAGDKGQSGNESGSKKKVEASRDTPGNTRARSLPRTGRTATPASDTRDDWPGEAADDSDMYDAMLSLSDGEDGEASGSEDEYSFRGPAFDESSEEQKLPPVTWGYLNSGGGNSNAEDNEDHENWTRLHGVKRYTWLRDVRDMEDDELLTCRVPEVVNLLNTTYNEASDPEVIDKRNFVQLLDIYRRSRTWQGLWQLSFQVGVG